MRTYGWYEFNDNNLPNGYRYLATGPARYALRTLKNGISVTDTYSKSSVTYVFEGPLFSKDITIYLNGLDHFDFYITQNFSDKYYPTSSEYQLKTGKIYIGNLDSDDPKSDYKRILQDFYYGMNDDTDVLGFYKQSSSYNNWSYYTKEKICSSMDPYWKHIEFVGIDPTIPHKIKIKAEVSISGSFIPDRKSTR